MRGIAFLLLALLGFFTPWWFFLVGAFMYMWFWKGGELFIITVALDIHFGGGGLFSGALYTLGLGAAFLIMFLVKKNLIFES